MTTLNDLMNICQMIKLENREKTKIKFVGEQFLTNSEKEKDYYEIVATKVKSIKLIFGQRHDGVRCDYDTIEIEIG